MAIVAMYISPTKGNSLLPVHTIPLFHVYCRHQISWTRSLNNMFKSIVDLRATVGILDHWMVSLYHVFSETKMASSDKRNQGSPALWANWESKGAQSFFRSCIMDRFAFNLHSCTLGWSWLALGDPWRIPNDKQWDRQNRLGGAKNITMLRAFHQTFSPSQMWHGTKLCKYDNGVVEGPGIPGKSHVHFRTNKEAKHHFDDTVNWNLWVKRQSYESRRRARMEEYLAIEDVY